MRITVYFDDGKVMAVRERLSKNPSGNGAQRAKAIRSGWKPDWIKAEMPRQLENYEELNLNSHIIIVPVGEVPEPLEVQGALTLSAFLTATIPEGWDTSSEIDCYRAWNARYS